MADTKNQASSSETSTSELNQEPCSSTSSGKSSSSPAESTSNSTESKLNKELLSRALQSMQHGKRHVIVSDYKSAVPCFETACELLGQCYGLYALECAEAYLLYGTALYEMSRLEDDLDGDVVKSETEENSADSSNDNEEEDEDDDDGVENKNNEAEAKTKEDGKEVKNEPSTPIESVDQTDSPKNDIDLMSQQPSTSKGLSSSMASANGDEGDKDQDDNATDFEIAYEVLITAKEIYSKHLDNKENRKNYAEALQKLGEISIDWDNPDGAIKLLNESLEHRKSVLQPDDRLIAATYHYLGMAFASKCDYEGGNVSFQKALDVIQSRIDNLKAKDTSNMDLFEKANFESEIEQLESLIPEIEKKIQDMKEMIQSKLKAKMTLEKENQELLKPKPINNITHLIKRKREEDNENHLKDSEQNCNAKKICSSQTSTTDTMNNDNYNNDVSSTTLSSSKTTTAQSDTIEQMNASSNSQNMVQEELQ